MTADAVDVDHLGVGIRLVGEDHQAQEVISGLLADVPAWDGGLLTAAARVASVDGGWTLTSDDGTAWFSRRSGLADAVVRWMHGVARQTPLGTLLHGGGVAGPSGVALVAGRSGAGKSTLVAAAAADGLGVLGDELVGLDGHRVVGSCLPLNLKRGSGAVRPGVGDGGPVTVSSFGGRPVHVAGPIVAVVLLSDNPGPVTEISRRDAALALLQLTVAVDRSAALLAVAAAVENAACLSMGRVPLATTLPYLRRMVGVVSSPSS